MKILSGVRTMRGTWLLVVGALFVLAAIAATQQPVRAQGNVDVGGKIKAENACYVRMPDIPKKLYGGFGGYNPDSGVLTFAGGAQALTADKVIADYELYGLRLDGAATDWSRISYGGNVGYTREKNKGCREMTSVQLANHLWVSVLGTAGCDNGNINGEGGDVRVLQIGEKADRSNIKWLTHALNVGSVPRDLAEQAGSLVRHFAVVDAKRGRGVFGQGTFDEFADSKTQEKIYSAAPSGTKWNVRELRPTGDVPMRRYGSCAAYVQNDDAGVDGMLVLGGRHGGTTGSAYKEVWWLDFSKRSDGEWTDVSARFDNLNDFGYRHEGACAYDPTSKQFYSWMGRADKSVPDGAKQSAGVWRADLSMIGDANATLHWERLAADNLAGIDGRRLIPSVYDWANKRLFVMGGRNELSEYDDVWAIYPDVTGDDCDNLDPYAPFADAVPSPTPDEPGPPTATPDPGGGQPTVAPPTPTAVQGQACASLASRVPQALVNAALTNPATVAGWDVACNPSLPPSHWNAKRSWLTLQNGSLPFHPLFNTLVWKCGCR